MGFYKYDLHVHTAELSPCGQVKIEKMVELYKNEGYTGIVITDHFRQKFFDDYQNWDQGIDEIMSAFTKAKKAGKKIGLEVLLGLEVNFDEIQGDFLIFGIDENFLRTHKNFPEGSLKDFNQLVAGKEILVYEAHPFRNKMKAADPELLDGLEIYNGNPRHDSNNPLAYLEAQKHNLKMISGSDFHQIEDLGKGGIIVSKKIINNQELLAVLRDEEFELIGEELPFVIESSEINL